MCGIFGIVTENPSGFPEQVAKAASQALFHRGPDEIGVFHEPGCLLGMRRLAIIDPCGSHPPFSNESGRIQVVGNGEIYNYREIRHRLIRNGHEFRSQNDIETVAHIAEEPSLDWELGLRGMFALAIWDRSRRSLHLCRDRFGIKPLFWVGGKQALAFASTLPALREMLLAWGKTGAGGDMPPDLAGYVRPEGWRLNREAIRWYLDTLAIPAPTTIYAGVSSLPPAGRIVWGPGTQPRIETYWTPTYKPKRVINQKRALEELIHAFKESIRYHLVSDVPVGAFLSGGIDSGLIVAEAAAQAGKRLSTYTVGFEEEDYSETELAREVARMYGTDHHEIRLKPFTIDDLPSIVDGLNQPLGDSSVWPTWAISRAVGGDLKVALAGDGGDEVWGGYPYYSVQNYSRWLPKHREGSISLGITSNSRLKRLSSVVGDCFRPPEDLYRRWRHLDPRGDFWDKILLPEFRTCSVRIPMGSDNGITAHDRMLQADVGFYLPYDLLEKVDTMSMASSLEVRVPWLDPALFELVAHLPRNLKIRGGTTKWLARKMAWDPRSPRLPESLLRQPKKGFAIPVHSWMRHELAELFQEIPLAKNAEVSHLFDTRQLRRQFEAHRSRSLRIGHQMWSILILELWLRQNGVQL